MTWFTVTGSRNAWLLATENNGEKNAWKMQKDAKNMKRNRHSGKSV
jgi:hypothetical protein